jgi:hypothetical protein
MLWMPINCTIVINLLAFFNNFGYDPIICLFDFISNDGFNLFCMRVFIFIYFNVFETHIVSF